MVGGSAAAFEDLDFAVRAFGNAEEHFFEVESMNASGATAGDEDPGGVEDTSGEIVQAMVGAESGGELSIGAGHAGRIEDDGIEFFAGVDQLSEGIVEVGDLEADIGEVI